MPHSTTFSAAVTYPNGSYAIFAIHLHLPYGTSRAIFFVTIGPTAAQLMGGRTRLTFQNIDRFAEVPRRLYEACRFRPSPSSKR